MNDTLDMDRIANALGAARQGYVPRRLFRCPPVGRRSQGTFPHDERRRVRA